MPKGERACQTEGAHAQGSAWMPNGGCTCPRERAHAKWRVHMPMGEFGVYVDNSGFPVKIWGFQREPARAKRRATCPTDRAHANRRAHVPNIARALLDLGNPKFSPGHARPPRPRKPQILPRACAPSPTSETPNSPLGMRALPGPRSPQFSPHMGSFSACERSLWKPQNFHWNPQIFQGNPKFSLEAPIFPK
jgi:hypothetical protein